MSQGSLLYSSGERVEDNSMLFVLRGEASIFFGNVWHILASKVDHGPMADKAQCLSRSCVPIHTQLLPLTYFWILERDFRMSFWLIFSSYLMLWKPCLPWPVAIGDHGHWSPTDWGRQVYVSHILTFHLDLKDLELWLFRHLLTRWLRWIASLHGFGMSRTQRPTLGMNSVKSASIRSVRRWGDDSVHPSLRLLAAAAPLSLFCLGDHWIILISNGIIEDLVHLRSQLIIDYPIMLNRNRTVAWCLVQLKAIHHAEGTGRWAHGGWHAAAARLPYVAMRCQLTKTNENSDMIRRRADCVRMSQNVIIHGQPAISGHISIYIDLYLSFLSFLSFRILP